MTKRHELQIVAQVESRAPHNRYAAEARIKRALAYHVRYAFVSPEQSNLVDEMTEAPVEIGVSPRACRDGSASIAERAPVRSKSIASRVTKHFSSIKLIQRECAFAA